MPGRSGNTAGRPKSPRNDKRHLRWGGGASGRSSLPASLTRDPGRPASWGEDRAEVRVRYCRASRRPRRTARAPMRECDSGMVMGSSHHHRSPHGLVVEKRARLLVRPPAATCNAAPTRRRPLRHGRASEIRGRHTCGRGRRGRTAYDRAARVRRSHHAPTGHGMVPAAGATVSKPSKSSNCPCTTRLLDPRVHKPERQLLVPSGGLKYNWEM